MKKQAKGFTLIELVIVIMLMSILAAVALSRYTDMQVQSRIATMKGLAATLLSTVALVKAQYFVMGGTGATITLADGTVVDVNYYSIYKGVPGGGQTGIGNALQLKGYSVDYSDPARVLFTLENGPSSCYVTYNGSTGEVGTDALTPANCS